MRISFSLYVINLIKSGATIQRNLQTMQRSSFINCKCFVELSALDGVAAPDGVDAEMDDDACAGGACKI